MSIPIRTPDQEYLPNGHFEKLRLKFPKDKGFFKDWNVVVHFYNTDAHDLHSRLATRTDCASFTDFIFLFKKSFYFLMRTLRQEPEFNQKYVVRFQTRNLNYIVAFMGEVDGVLRVELKTISERHWRLKPDDKVLSIGM